MEFAEDRRLMKEQLETPARDRLPGTEWSERGVCRPGG